ncbi:MAG: trehalose-phosphatase [Dermatophilaceae bacterium]
MSDLPGSLRAALEAFVQRPRILIGADFDGTLAPFATDPMKSRAAPGAFTSLYAAASLPGVTVALVSGRDLATLRTLTGIPQTSPIVLIGSHGGQSSLRGIEASATIDQDASARLAAAQADLQLVAEAHPGTRVEIKPGAVALHTRGADASVGEAALAAALAVSTRHTGVQVIPGKQVLELTVLETDKGSALRALAADRGVDAIAYFGDDVTDERAFAALDPEAGDVTVKVGEGDTLATYRLNTVGDVVLALDVTLSARQSASRV